MGQDLQMPLGIDEIEIGEGRRPVDFDAVRRLAASIDEIGLKHPVTVRRKGDRYLLVAGLHRLEACRKLGREHVPAIICTMTNVEARMWEIAENLHRADLTRQERADQIAEWIELVAEAKPAQLAHVSGGRGREGGISAASRDLGIDRDEARRAIKIASITPEAKEAARAVDLDDNQSVLLRVAESAPEAQLATLYAEADKRGKSLPNGARAIMSARQEPDDSLDFFPTPPWATRALIERVFVHMGIDPSDSSAWDPACGEGHMAAPLAEYFREVHSTDLHDYGWGFPPLDFLADDSWEGRNGYDWIITNPPFGEKTEAFVLRALDLARQGVAMFVRLQWLETIGRYERLFRDRPPTLIAFFCERVNLCKGRWDPEGSTATAYIWLVWRPDALPQPPFWIPPGCREALTLADDVERFTAHPVNPRFPPQQSPSAPDTPDNSEAA